MELKCHENYIARYRSTKRGEREEDASAFTLHDHIVVLFLLFHEVRTAFTLVPLSVYFRFLN